MNVMLQRLGLPILTGILVAASYPPLELRWLAWVAWVPLLHAVFSCSRWQAFCRGFLSGLVGWLLGLAWLIALAETGCDLPTALGAWCGLSIYAALYVACFALFVRDAHRRFSTRRRVPSMLLIASAWVALEFARLTIATGFPWNPIGVSQFRNLAFIQLAALGGVPLLSWILMYVNGQFAVLLNEAATRTRLFVLGKIIGILLLVHLVGWLRFAPSNRLVQDSSLRVAVLDPGLPQTKKWVPELGAENLARIMDLAAGLTNEHVSLVVLPETTVPGAPGYDTETDAFINIFPGMVNAMTVLGAVEAEPLAEGEYQYYNSALLLDRSGRTVGRYRKTHLVPFGEYIPLVEILPLMKRIMPVGFFSCVPGQGVSVFDAEGADGVSPLICFEDTIAGLSRTAVNKGATCLVFITNDAWYPETAASLQHLSHCVFRCVETGRWGLRAGNMGATGFISDKGSLDILDESGVTAGYRVRDVPRIHDTGIWMPYLRYGDRCWAWPCVLVTCVTCIFMVANRKMRVT